MDVRDWPAVWLRDNCPCPDGRDPDSGQKLFQITDLDRSRDADLRVRLPLIELSANGRIRGVRFNNRSTQALRGPAGELAAFYAAYRRWAALLARPERAVALAREEVAR